MQTHSGSLKKSIKQQMYYATGIVTTKIIAIIMLPVFTHFLSPTDYARLDIIQTLANLMCIIVAFGLADSLFRFAGESNDPVVRQHMAATTFALALVSLVIGTAITQLIAPLLSQILPGNISLFQTRTILGSLSVTACILVPLAWLRMQDNAALFFLVTTGWTASQAGMTVLALSMGYGVDGILVSGLICSILLAIILSIYQMKSTGICFSAERLTAQGRFGGMLVLAGIATFIIDCSGRWMLVSEVGVLALAEYALAWKVGIMALLFTEPFSMWWMPKRFEVLKEVSKAQCASTTEIGIVIALISVVVISSMGALTITLLSPLEYHGAIKYVPAFALIAGIKAITSLLTTGILSEKETLKPIYIDSAAAAVALICNLIFIPYFEVWGVIFALMIALLLRLFCYFLIGQRVNYLPYHLPRMYLLFCLVIIIIALISQADTPFVTLFIGACGGVILLLSAFITGSIPTCMLYTLLKKLYAPLHRSLYIRRS
jgi:O-antigen/teichoic acid export membrane protein